MPDDTVIQKRCTKCGAVKPSEDFHRRKRSLDGMTTWCKPCAAEYAARYRLTNPEKCKASRDAWKAANTERVAMVEAARYARNADSINARERERYAEDPEPYRVRHRAWYEANRESRKAVARLWSANNADRHRELIREWAKRNPEKTAEYGKLYLKRYPARNAERVRRRYAKIRGVTIGIVDLDALPTEDCGICSLPLDLALAYPEPMSRSLDHTIPISKNGPHEQSNLQWAHLICNIRKGTKII